MFRRFAAQFMPPRERAKFPVDEKNYRKLFPKSRRKEAHKQALDIRKFEIELYWKRASYFWTLIAAAFAGYFAIQKDAEFTNVYLVTSLGFLFSLAWYLVNRASASWQRNWEGHVDLLEDTITGPLHKTHINRTAYAFFDLLHPYSFSPSRINTALALIITLAWVFLMGRAVLDAYPLFEGRELQTAIVITALTLAAATTLIWSGRPSGDDDLVVIRRKRIWKKKKR